MAGPWEKYQQPEADSSGPWSKYQPPKQTSILDSIGKGAEGFGTGLLTGVGKFADDNKGLLGSMAGLTLGQLPGSPISQSISSAMPSAGDATKEAGLQPGMASSIGEAVGRTAPYFAAPGLGEESLLGRLGGQALRGAAAGAQTTQGGIGDKLGGAALGAATAGAGEGALALAGKGAQSVGKAIVKNIYRPLINKLKEPMQNTAQTDLDEGAQTLKSIYDAKKMANNNDWSKAEVLANQLGDTPFDNTDYLNALQKEKDGVVDKIGGKGNLQTKFQGGLDALDGFMEQPPTNFRDAMRVRQDINAAKDNATKPNGLPSNEGVNSVSGAARDALLNQVNSNILNTPEASAFGDAWTNANQGYKNLQQYKMAPKAGTLENSINLSKAMNGDPEGKVFNDFIPSGKNDTGTTKFQHLGVLLGNAGQANHLIKSAMFNSSIKDGFNPDVLLNQYKRLSPVQRGYLFNPTEKSNLENALQAKNIGQNNKAANSIGQVILRHSLSAGLGAGLAHQVGINPWLGASVGALGANVLKRGAGSLAEQIGMNNPERYINLARQAPQFNKTASVLNALTSAAVSRR